MLSSVYILECCLCARMTELMHMCRSYIIQLQPIKMHKDRHPEEAEEKVLTPIRDITGTKLL